MVGYRHKTLPLPFRNLILSRFYDYFNIGIFNIYLRVFLIFKACRRTYDVKLLTDHNLFENVFLGFFSDELVLQVLHYGLLVSLACFRAHGRTLDAVGVVIGCADFISEPDLLPFSVLSLLKNVTEWV